jgi:DNA-binding XRE family transcriptional regulator
MALTVLHSVAARTQGSELHAGRVANGWTHRQCAEAVGAPRDTWIKWERGVRSCPPEIRERFAGLWGLDRGRLGLDPERSCPCCGQEYG